MSRYRLAIVAGVIGLLVLWSAGQSARTQEPPAQPGGVEVLARGPVHEAFAQPATTQPAPGPVALKPPPEPIEEIAPDQKPDGEDVQWISGYWSWDEDRNDYIWVSGFWRVPPPGHQWLAGHWQPIAQGWQWVAGFWAPANVEEVQYLPAPPPSIDEGPATPAPDANSTYVPGVWTYQQTRYFWRPGYWVGNRPDWVWNPAHYIWTPSGYLYNDGYWDYPLDERGLLFAPAFFGREWGNRRFIPQYVVNSDFLLGALFVRSAGQHYYFGDYFEPRYATRGFVAWPDYRVGRAGFDTNYNYYRYQHAADPRWDNNLRELYHARASGTIPRPPTTWDQQVRAVNTFNGNRTGGAAVHNSINLTNVQNVTALTTLAEVHNTRVTNLSALGQAREAPNAGRAMTLRAVPPDEHARELQAAAQSRAAAQQRREVEGRMLSQGGVPVRPTDPPKVANLGLPKVPPPVVAPPPGQRQAQPPPATTPPPGQRQNPPPVTTPPPGQRQGQPPPPPVVTPPPGQRQNPPPPPVVTPPPGQRQAPPPPVTIPPPGQRQNPPPPPVVTPPPGQRQNPPPPPVVAPPQHQPPPPPVTTPPPGRKQPPPLPVLPKHEERPIPKYEPPPPPTPPKRGGGGG